MKVLPRTMNLASKGAFVAFVTLPDGYDTRGVIKDSVLCNGAPAEKIIRSNRFPRVFGAVFRKEKLQGDTVGAGLVLTMTGKISKDGKIYEFTATDILRAIRKYNRIPDDDDDLSKGMGEKNYEDRMFDRYNRDREEP
jgi:hypothetical protein